MIKREERGERRKRENSDAYQNSENDTIGTNMIQATPRDPLEVLVGLVTKLRAKRFKEAFNGLLQCIWTKIDFKRILNNKAQALIYLIHV
jgi:hypothetical protein